MTLRTSWDPQADGNLKAHDVVLFVGIVSLGSFCRRIDLWLCKKKKKATVLSS